MEQESQTVAQQARNYEYSQGVGEDLNYPADYNLIHLTESEAFEKFIENNPILAPLGPLGDQIFATSFLSERGVYSYKLKIRGIILRIKMDIPEDNPDMNHVLRTAETWLFNLVEGCKNGYRGRLATEVRRTYTMENLNPQRKRWGLF